MVQKSLIIDTSKGLYRRPKFYFVLILARERVALGSSFFDLTYLFYLYLQWVTKKNSRIEPTLEGP